MAQIETLDKELFADFLGGRIVESNTGVAYVLTLLELVGRGVYFKPHYMPSHDSMLRELTAKVGEVGFAGRVLKSQFPNSPIVLDRGGTSMTGYKINRVEEMQALLYGWLAEMNYDSVIELGR